MKEKRSWRRTALILSLFCLTFLTGLPQAVAQVEESPSLDFPMKDKLIEVAKETVKAYETGNWEAIKATTTADASFYNLGSYDSLSVDQTVNYWQKGREIATPLLSGDGVWLGVAVPEGPREGNWVLHWGNNTLTYPTGETISFPYHVAFKFEGQKVNQVHFYYDNNRIIRALGYEIQPPFIDSELPEENGN